MKFGRFISKMIMVLVIPILVVSALAASFGFNSIFEMLKSLVENVLPFGNVVADIMSYHYNVQIGKDITVLLVISDVIKALISSVLFTLFVSVIPAIFPVMSKKAVPFFFLKTLLAILVALVSGFVLDRLEDKLSEFTYKTVPVMFFIIIFVICSYYWFRHMILHGFKLGFAATYFLTGKLIPSLLRTVAIYACLSMTIIIITDKSLSMAFMPIVILIFGIAMVISSVFENGFVNKVIGSLWD